ncbi:MAG: hypothetical protein JNJ73_01030 [Hyphomonadaceae bacterium]|nr:hypothetical protein [Hyphomonadaceae bacterium]
MPVRGQSWALDDIPEGYVHVFGAYELTADEIARFKAAFAPGAADEAAAPEHVFAVWSRMVWEETKDWPILAKLSQDALRWLTPAKAGDVLQVRMECIAKEPVNDERGILIAKHEVLNQRGDLVLTLITRTSLKRKV